MNPNWKMCQSERCWHRYIWRCTRLVHFDNRHLYQAVPK